MFGPRCSRPLVVEVMLHSIAMFVGQNKARKKHIGLSEGLALISTHRPRWTLEIDQVSAFLLEDRCYGIALFHKPEREQHNHTECGSETIRLLACFFSLS